MTVLGAGVVGIEYASIFAALGIAVTLVDTRDRLLPYFDREIVATLVRELRRARRQTDPRRPLRADHAAAGDAAARRVRDRRPAARLESDVLLYCVGRDGNTNDIGLGTLGITPGKYGLLEVNEHYQTVHPHIYAVGDVIGYPALASTVDGAGPPGDAPRVQHPRTAGDATETLPFAVYSIPEVAYVGATEEALVEKKVDYVAGRGDYRQEPARPDPGRLGRPAEAALRVALARARRRAHRGHLGERAHPHRRGLPARRARRPPRSPRRSTTTRRFRTCTATPRSRRSAEDRKRREKRS